ncbi:hypothetical protein LINGRAHAP2_LOCUS17706, partial [Linum grandiflorum]
DLPPLLNLVLRRHPVDLCYLICWLLNQSFSLGYDMADCLATPCSRGNVGMGDQSMSVVRNKTEEEASYYGSDSDFDCGSDTEFESDDEKVDDWTAGLLYTRGRGRGVTLCLMNSAKQKLQNSVRHIRFKGDAGTGFTMIESKLYAFGGLHPGSGITDFFVYDLENLRARKFKRVGRLLTPKTAPVVIPYDSGNNTRKKIFIIPTGYNELPKDMSCEVIYLPCEANPRYELKRLTTPFDDAYWRTPFPSSEGFTVSGKYAYVHLKSDIWTPEDRLLCLDMDADEFKFKFCDDNEEHNDKSFPKGIYGLWEYMPCICRDKLFLVTWSISSSNVEIYGSSILSEKQQIQPLEELSPISAYFGVERLVDIENYVNTQLKDFHGMVQSWTLPFDSEAGENAYSMFICYRTPPPMERRLLVCNFKLVESQAMDADADARKSRYKSDILSCALYRNFTPGMKWPVHAFTRSGNLMFP